ncbi:FAD-binding oxidoreductase [Amnibacterium sp.]|uniref:NAD(P)/FAD-dependent oxidoreductase n=1 Tax=Amnibacterium sp. TaxID=1872496 RepID=UPI002624CBBE|nr:FAD-binding oxidoreductase [Amnibacterium sp.]
MGPPVTPGRPLWLDDIERRDRPPLPGDTRADVCIVGAGFTGLWAALGVLEREPDATVVVVEQAFAGFGASGRNGGWCSALFPVSGAELVRRHGRDAAIRMRTALHDTVDEVGRAGAELGIDFDYVKGGTHSLVRSATARLGAEAELEDAVALGLPAPEWRERAGLGATLFDPQCARISPGKLVGGLALAAEDRGVRIHEGTRVLHVHPHEVLTDHGVVRADRVVVAAEAWAARLPGFRRRVLPLYSLMIATEPLAESTWASIGLEHGETVTDFRHLLVYGQRTADDRLAFGGRGARYHLGSTIKPEWDVSTRVFAHLERALGELFPAAAAARITHRWGGPIGVPRNWHPAVVPLRGGIVWAGGYVGDGVAAANLAGRTVADLVTDRRTPLTVLPWVGHVPPRWEPEPLRVLGVNAVVAASGVADAEERLTGAPSRVAGALSRLGLR